MTPELFDRTRLSVREDMILGSAIEGLTDVQISQRLAISQSTVNSYWVRIRGKLGQLSRTELVALALKAQAQAEMAAARAELDALRDEAASHVRISADYARAEVLRAALDATPEALLVGCHRGLIRYVNPRLEAMFGYGPGELVDRPLGELALGDLSLGDLAPSGVQTIDADWAQSYLRDPRPLRLGFDRVVYGRRKDGSRFRVVLLVDTRPTSTGAILTLLVRDFIAELETRRSHAAARGWAPA